MKKLICILTGALLPLSMTLAEKPAEAPAPGGEETEAKEPGKKAPGKGDPAARLDGMFDKIDTDKSGGLSLDEMKAADAKRKAAAPAGGAPKGGKAPKGSVEDRHKKTDADGDGEVTKEEFKKAMAARMKGGAGGGKGGGKGGAKGGGGGGGGKAPK